MEVKIKKTEEITIELPEFFKCGKDADHYYHAMPNGGIHGILTYGACFISCHTIEGLLDDEELNTIEVVTKEDWNNAVTSAIIKKSGMFWAR